MGRHDKATGRGKSERFVRLPHFMLRSYAWSRLTPVERSVWIELAALYDGTNNGRIAASVRSIADRVNVSYPTVSRALQTLITLGFIELTHKSDFSSKQRIASEFRLTHLKCDRTGALAKSTFMNLGKANSHSFTDEPEQGAQFHPSHVTVS
jgi:DNA-binding transcriptional regulator YhcF (GntR family)